MGINKTPIKISTFFISLMLFYPSTVILNSDEDKIKKRLQRWMPCFDFQILHLGQKTIKNQLFYQKIKQFHGYIRK